MYKYPRYLLFAETYNTRKRIIEANVLRFILINFHNNLRGCIVTKVSREEEKKKGIRNAFGSKNKNKITIHTKKPRVVEASIFWS